MKRDEKVFLLIITAIAVVIMAYYVWTFQGSGETTIGYEIIKLFRSILSGN